MFKSDRRRHTCFELTLQNSLYHLVYQTVQTTPRPVIPSYLEKRPSNPAYNCTCCLENVCCVVAVVHHHVYHPSMHMHVSLHASVCLTIAGSGGAGAIVQLQYPCDALEVLFKVSQLKVIANCQDSSSAQRLATPANQARRCTVGRGEVWGEAPPQGAIAKLAAEPMFFAAESLDHAEYWHACSQ
eukprot:349632-Chlamydomonas_euryale.AAC.57